MKRAACNTIALDQRDKERIRTVRSYIMSNLDRELTIKEIAATFSMSMTTLRRQFILFYDIPVHQFILRCRMRRAKKLIMDDDCPLDKIPVKIGYKSFASFRKAFFGYYNVTPHAMQQSR